MAPSSDPSRSIALEAITRAAPGLTSIAPYERALSALHDLGWRPLGTEADPRYLRWCEWPDCLRSFNILDGPDPERDGKGWIYVRTGTHVLLCPDHANAGHRPQRFEWQPGDTTINTSCECGDRGERLKPTTNERCVQWWREHVRKLAAPASQEGGKQ